MKKVEDGNLPSQMDQDDTAELIFMSADLGFPGVNVPLMGKRLRPTAMRNSSPEVSPGV